MWQDQNIQAKYSRESAPRLMMQKDMFPVNDAFKQYLIAYDRDVELPILYQDLVNYSYAKSLKDKKGKWTLWENAVYEPRALAILKVALIKTYLALKKNAFPAGAGQLDIECIDFCDYGNSMPFRVTVINKDNGQLDFFYVKQADASRIYGLELEHLLSEHPINFLHHEHTLVEAHIAGTPGDVFLQLQPLETWEMQALAKAFVHFNENCFVRLLGDMRSYNFVVVPSPGREPAYLIRAIDFDQQCYEGRKSFYFPRFYKENEAYVQLVLQHLSALEIEQTREAGFDQMAVKIITYRRRLMELLNSMVNDDISENFKIQMLRNELNEHFETTRFSGCKTMGAILKQQLKQVLRKHVQLAGIRERG
ncbi:MAG: hypothetical protein WKI04_14095 [Ferruginibacter sp.]